MEFTPNKTVYLSAETNKYIEVQQQTTTDQDNNYYVYLTTE